MKKINSYIICEAHCESECAKQINATISNGYQPYGKLKIFYNPKHISLKRYYYVQAMVRYEESDTFDGSDLDGDK